jgi:hypothetical protein
MILISAARLIPDSDSPTRPEIPAEGEVEVEAVLEALVAEADDRGAGVVGTALGFE